MCASVPPFFIHADKRSFSLLVSRDESRNEAPSIMQLIFRNFSKKEEKEHRGECLSHLLKLTPDVAEKREARQKRATRAKKVRDREKKRRWEKRKIISYIRRPRCNGGYFALQNTRSTPVPTSPPALSPLVIPAISPENNIYLLPARGKRTKMGNELRKEKERQSSLWYIRVVSFRRKRNFQSVLMLETETISLA